MQTQVSKLLSALSKSLETLTTHLRGGSTEWVVKAIPSGSNTLLVCYKERKAFLEVEVAANGSVYIRPLDGELEKTEEVADFNSQKSKRLLKDIPPKPPIKALPRARRTVSISAGSRLFTDFSTPGCEGKSNAPAQLDIASKRGAKGRKERGGSRDA